jgi:hypothetical protein
MNVLYFILGVIVFILIIAALVGTKWTLERSTNIYAPIEKVWENVRSLEAMNRWSPWARLDPEIMQEITGVDGKPGAKYSWKSNQKNVGEGSQTITRLTEKAEIRTIINFIKPIRGTAEGYIKISKEGPTTRAIWGINSSTPYPVNIIKIFGIIEKSMEKDFEKGLKELKSLCEK